MTKTMRGIAFPLRVSGGSLGVSEDTDLVRDAIVHVLNIPSGEYLTLPFYGVQGRAFDSLKDAGEMTRDIENRLRNQVGATYPNVSFDCTFAVTNEGTLEVIVNWAIAEVLQPPLSLRIG